MAKTKNILLVPFLIIMGSAFVLTSHGQTNSKKGIKILAENKGISLRGLSIPNKNTIWVSGSKGTIVKSTDGGVHFEWMTVPGFEKNDFRGIHAWNDQEAIIISIASPGYILKTKDGGVNWYKVYENSDTSIFLDAIHFKDEQNGVVIGDPINKQIIRLTTVDKGEHWQLTPTGFFKSTIKDGEAFFASSNSNMVYDYQSEYFVTGGKYSRLWKDGNAIDITIIQGLSSTGANSIAISPNKNKLIIAGGDFVQPNALNKNLILLKRYKYPNSNFKHLSENVYFWKIVKVNKQFSGYKSSVTFLNNRLILACGTSGIDASKNGGKTWEKISSQSFHVVQKQPGTNNAFLAGKDGRIGYLIY